MTDIKSKLESLKKEIPEHVKLVVVTKTHTVETIMEAYDAGHRIFGENKSQELINKQPQLPDDIEWHFIGHLQTNKVKYIAPFVALIHAVDSLKLLKEINKQALKNERIIDCLLQFHIATEETKFGLDINEAKEILEAPAFKDMKNIRLTGVMGMATFIHDEDIVRREFKSLKEVFNRLKESYFSSDDSFADISMGMSGDYQTAIQEGSTIVRIGTLIFGNRYGNV